MTRTWDKACSKCGVVKPASEYYVKGYKNGKPFLSSKCKVCNRKINANRKRKSDATYSTLKEIQARKKPLAVSAITAERRLLNSTYGRKWVALCMASARDEIKEVDAWTLRCESAARIGMIAQRNRDRILKGMRRRRENTTWEQMAAHQHRAGISGYIQSRNVSKWKKKMVSITANWRKKV